MTSVIPRQSGMGQLIQAVATELRGAVDVADALSRVTELVGRGLGGQRVFVRLGFDGEEAPRVVAEWTDADTSRVDDLPPVEVSPSLGELIVRSGRTDSAVVIGDIALDRRLMPSDVANAIRCGVCAALVFPLVEHGRPVGSLVVHDTRHPRTWDATQVATFEAIGRETAGAVNRARALELERELAARMRALDAERSEFLASVSHELRSPLTNILGYLELMQDGELGALTEAQGSVIGVIERNGRRLLGLIEDLLAVSSVERGSFEIRFAPVDLQTLVEAVCRTIAIRVREGGIALTVDVPDGPCHALGDGQQLERVVLNLATNALQFTPPGGAVVISLRREEATIRIEVSDTGVGVAEADRARVFERFYRAAHDGREPPSGTGLGLYVVKHVVESHGGSVELESELGVGTRVTCVLPAAPTPDSPTNREEP